MPTISAQDAILKSHRKAAEIRSLCAIHDRILLNIRQEYQFPVEPEKWAAGLAERLEYFNKDYRRQVRSSSQALATRLQSLYGRRAAARLSASDVASGHSTTQESSLVIVSEQSPEEPRVDEAKADIMCDLLTRVEVALQLCTSLEDRVPQLTRLYEAHRDVVPLPKRVLLHRNLSRCRRGLDEALVHKTQIQHAMEEWRPYFEVLADETALTRLLDEVRAQKLSAKACLGEVTPVVDHFRALRDKCDDIMNKSTALSFAHETNWLSLGLSQLSSSLVADELCKYDDLLDDAKQQQAPHKDILSSFEHFKDRSMSPQVVRGPSGVDIELSSLSLAYVQFREVHFACNAAMRLAKPLLGVLEGDIKGLSTYDREGAAVVTE